MKFGGTSVEDAAAFERVAGIIERHRTASPVVVVSAMSRVTDALVSSFRMATDGSANFAFRSLDETFERHLQVAHRLLSGAALNSYQNLLKTTESELAGLFTSASTASLQMHPPLQDQIVSFGEQLSSALLTLVMCQAGLPARHVDARRCLVTDERHGCATPLMAATKVRTRNEIEHLLNASVIPVLGGFIAATESGIPTTLGRNGSDYTAALLGAALSASEIQIWTDVTGILTADPKLVSLARTIPQMSYTEAVELSRFGAKVIYPKAIQPAALGCIPLRICNSRAPYEFGTIVCAEQKISTRIIKSIAHKTPLKLVRINSQEVCGRAEFLRGFCKFLERQQAEFDIISIAGSSISLTLEETSALPELIEEMQHLGTVQVVENCALICIVGEGLSHSPGLAGLVFGALSDINIALIAQGGSSSSMIFVVEGTHSVAAVQRLHQILFECDFEEPLENAPSDFELVIADN